MQGLITFHPLDPAFLDDVIAPLAAGSRVNPEGWLSRCLRLHSSATVAAGYKVALDHALRGLEPPPAPEGSTLWTRVRTRLESIDHRPDAISRLVAGRIDPDLHLRGRPFLVLEGSSDRVATLVDEYMEATDAGVAEGIALEQLLRIDREIPAALEVERGPPGADLAHRSELLSGLREIHDISVAAREGRSWARGDGPPRSAADVAAAEFPWRAMDLHAKAYPAWAAENVDGLETVCRAAGIEPPGVLTTARGAFAKLSSVFPAIRDGFRAELNGPCSVGGYVAPRDVGQLLAFLGSHGAGIIQVATRHGEGPACTLLLRKIRECATYAERLGLGYLEASGVRPPGHVGVEAEEDTDA